MRLRLRTLLIVLAVGPPVLALAWFYSAVLAALVASVGTILAAESILGFLFWWHGRSNE